MNESLPTRREFLLQSGLGLGAAALSSLSTVASPIGRGAASLLNDSLHHAATAKRVIYIFQAGGPAQMELYDHKPQLAARHGEELPESILKQQRLTGFTIGQKKYPIIASPLKFSQHGECGAWMSELLPRLAGSVDDMCFVRSVHTEAVNHDPAVTMMMTGTQQPGRPSIGAWLSYGIGSENHDLPSFVVLLTPGLIQDASTPVSTRHWGAGFLPSKHQGIKFRSGKAPVLYLDNPAGIDNNTRREMLNVTAQLNGIQKRTTGDPEIDSRIAQYELAHRMQMSVPELTDLSTEPQHIFDLYGPQSQVPGSFGANCLLARRLVEKGVRFVQIIDRDWDHHRNAPQHLKTKSQLSDQPMAALLTDLKQRGLLEDTLVVCGGEFGRTIYSQGPIQEKYGRDHHGGCFTMWMAGGGVRGGHSHGLTDEFSFNVAENPVHVHDLQATILHCLGIDHRRLTYKYQSRQFRLTDVEGTVVRDVLS